MLADTAITTLVAVRDLREGAAFYEQQLQLVRTDENTGWIQYRSGTSDIIIYESNNAGTNQATTAAWTVKDVEETVRGLKANGLNSFQHYDDLPDTVRDGDIHSNGPIKMAWFKDPFGNLFEVNGP